MSWQREHSNTHEHPAVTFWQRAHFPVPLALLLLCIGFASKQTPSIMHEVLLQVRNKSKAEVLGSSYPALV
jgi:hypothetical protein